METIIKFLNELETYQSNHYGMYNKQQLIIAYDNLPDKIKSAITPKSLKNLYRGCDGLSNVTAISFTNNKGYADTFGAYTIPFTELALYAMVISTDKCRKMANKLKLDVDIGDDEGEVIVLAPIWKKFNIEKYRN